ncbi:hypothetical protein [Actinomadura verrucosospora]|uniref:DUF485 domain-containing protein n=1 Tax=Actinomadura verrucosospora TaxID=46165 RepID=A0A7D4AV44_ACTVE|nr:hypothetical protein [Actinomadura verrucosospora]QKG26508.1 hypothetical protein ACTIVE_8161 [Actinomadura verrucosospora]
MPDPHRAPVPPPPADVDAPDPAGRDPSDPDPPDTGPPPARLPAPRDPPDPPARSEAPGPPAAEGPGRPADVRRLVRVQLRIALRTAAFVLAVTAAIPVLLVLAPDAPRPFGLPPSWLLPVAGVQPLWVLAALAHLRRAERAERDHPRPAGRP